jgi:pyruvate,orthophosphate dikinase
MSEYYVIAANRQAAASGPAEVGNKAWNLMMMADGGLSVPPAFVLPTSLCGRGANGDDGDIEALIARGVTELEALTGFGFGSTRRPLLLSVRSGAAASMPGMMETVLNVGLNDVTVEALIRASGNPRLAWDCYRRLIESYADVVAGLPPEPFDAETAKTVSGLGAAHVRELDFEGLRRLTRAMLETYRDLAGAPFPRDVGAQLSGAVRAVFRSWNAERAVVYRRLNGLDGLAGTAVTVQKMVFGNMGGFSGSGVAFTRDPADGADRLYLDFLANAQGEDIVAGRQRLSDTERLGEMLPDVRAELEEVRSTLESRFRDVQDFEFTVEEGRLWLLQTRRAKRTPWAALRIAVDMVDQGLITPSEALERLDGVPLDALERHSLAADSAIVELASAIPASVGIGIGRVAFGADAAKAMARDGAPSILLHPDTTTADIEAMSLAAGILTGAGGRTSHAAVVARQLNKVCLVGCLEMIIDGEGKSARFGSRTVREGDWLTLDGNTGAVFAGQAQVTVERPAEALARVEDWRRQAAGGACAASAA